MKTINQFIDEGRGYSAKDLVKKKDAQQDDRSGMRVSSDGEQDFKDRHHKTSKDHPVAGENQFKGATKYAGDHKGPGPEGPGEHAQLKTYDEFKRLGGWGKSSYRPQDKLHGDRAPVKQGSSDEKSLGEEAEDLDEISKKTLASYIRKAHVSGSNLARHHQDHGTQARMAAYSGDNEKADAHAKVATKSLKKSMSRERGINRASEKLASEENNIDEAFKAGSLKLKSGESVTMTSEDARAVNEAISSLNSVNRIRMEQELMKDSKSFQRVVEFAKSAA